MLNKGTDSQNEIPIMTKTVFLSDLSERLLAVTPERISPSDAVRSLDYYGGWIDSRMKDGMGEEEAVAALGQPEADTRHLSRDSCPLICLYSPAKPRDTCPLICLKLAR